MAGISISMKAQHDMHFNAGTHWCNVCTSYLPVSDFRTKRNGSHGLCGTCKACQDTKKTALRKNNPDYWRSWAPRRDKIQHERKRHWVTLAGGKCQRCGWNEHHSGFDFHHINATEKECQPSHLMKSHKNDEALGRELDKCALLCTNCHKLFHAGVWDGKWKKRESIGWTIDEEILLRE